MDSYYNKTYNRHAFWVQKYYVYFKTIPKKNIKINIYICTTHVKTLRTVYFIVNILKENKTF